MAKVEGLTDTPQFIQENPICDDGFFIIAYCHGRLICHPPTIHMKPASCLIPLLQVLFISNQPLVRYASLDRENPLS